MPKKIGLLVFILLAFATSFSQYAASQDIVKKGSFQNIHKDRLNQDRCLNLFRPMSGERKEFCYWTKKGGFEKDGYLVAAHMLRDVHSKKVGYIDPQLLDILFLIQTWLKNEGRSHDIHIMSGYRTPAYNATLKGSAANSMHIYGRAADIHIPGLKTKVLALMSRYVGAGGVGIYVRNNFIHVDTGNIRGWNG